VAVSPCRHSLNGLASKFECGFEWGKFTKIKEKPLRAGKINKNENVENLISCPILRR
jgi:hypothetical protein